MNCLMSHHDTKVVCRTGLYGDPLCVHWVNLLHVISISCQSILIYSNFYYFVVRTARTKLKKSTNQLIATPKVFHCSKGKIIIGLGYESTPNTFSL